MSANKKHAYQLELCNLNVRTLITIGTLQPPGEQNQNDIIDSPIQHHLLGFFTGKGYFLSGLDSASLNMENRWVCLVVCLCVS